MTSRSQTRVLHYSLDKEQDRVVAQCLEIDVASDGVTAAEAYANLSEALKLYAEFEAWRPILLPQEPIVFTEHLR